MTDEIVKPPFYESFNKNWVYFFVDSLVFLKDNMHDFFKDRGTNFSGKVITGKKWRKRNKMLKSFNLWQSILLGRWRNIW